MSMMVVELMFHPVLLLVKVLLASARGLWSPDYWIGFDVSDVATGMGCSWSAAVC